VPDNPFEIRAAGGRKILFFKGHEVFLGGIHVDTEPLIGNLEPMLRDLASRNNNFFRHWVTAYYVYGNVQGTGNKSNCPFKYSSTTDKWDLSAYNADYFVRLKQMLAAARRAKVIVQLTIFDRTGLAADSFNPNGTPKELRWSVNPWNANKNVNGVINRTNTGLPDFFTRAASSQLANLQIAYAIKVVRETREFWNVVYEIINEPLLPAEESDKNRKLATWANDMLNAIAPLIQGRRLVFHNDHSGNLTDPTTRGRDVNYWRDQIPSQSSYGSLDGVILHGDPNLIDPAKTDTYGWTWGREKVIQLSTDAFGDEVPGMPGKLLRDDPAWNRATAATVLGRQEVYQAESIAIPVADAIGSIRAHPTSISLPPFLGCWEKISAVGPHFNLRFDGKSRFVAFDPVSDSILQQGTLDTFDDTTFTVTPDGQSGLTYTYSLSADGQSLTYTRGTLTQVFVRMLFDYEPFLFGWQKFLESTPSQFPNFLMYFGKNGTDLVTTLRDPTNPATIIDQGKVLEIHTETPVPQIKIFSQLLNSAPTYNYDFYNDAQNRPCLSLINTANNRRQDFRRTI
jgi:hypothetical protein